MLYEKKMLILSGSGKGVVLIEKSATGVKFTLRTFDLPCRTMPFKAGVVTKTKVFVRDLPHRDDPASTFTLELDSLDGLHFAVFDRELRLYGCIGKRMWEANLMDLLNRNDRRVPVTKTVPTALPPVSTPPRVLPLPDGTGLPQSRLSVYGDDALADSDFYTKIDMTERMQTVDGFLDTPRILDGLAPEITASTAVSSGVEEAEITESAIIDSADTVDAESMTETVESAEPSGQATDIGASGEHVENAAPAPEAAENTVAAEAVAETPTGLETDTATAVNKANAETTVGASAIIEEPASAEAAPVAGEAAEFEPTFEAAATASVQPWELTARWIKKRGGRELVVKKPRVRATAAGEKLRQLRATEFFERARRDIDILFASARRDEALNGLIDDVEWVKVDVDGNTVSVGRSGNAFLCYAVAGTYERTPPLGEEAQWLPRDKTAPTGKGYWVIFQNLTTGEIIK